MYTNVFKICYQEKIEYRTSLPKSKHSLNFVICKVLFYNVLKAFKLN